ncbi:MAG: hypothetical protein CK540_07825 [Thermoleophilia bacterium]|nr:MAG: hypothetical protein CK540_07825 [Thermoleophilia bacterium]
MHTITRPDCRHRMTLLIISAVLAFLLAQAAAAQAAPQLPLKTQGSTIVDAAGNEVVLQGVNWFGFETANHAPHGLWTRDYKEMLAQIKAQGFNTIRLPFSLQMLDSSTTSGIDYGNGRNAALQGKTPLQVMDVIIAEAGRQGLMIILDNHSTTDDSFMHPLWYGLGGYTEDNWVAAWSRLAARYATTPNVIGADLKNEPHGEATWGTGAANDWRRAAERGGNAVLTNAPNWLILVEGIEGAVAGGQQLDRAWWGGNLEGVRNNPVRLSIANRVVYSPHEYGPGVFAQPWFSDPNMVSILADRWQKGFDYIKDEGIAPLLIGEFGAKNVGTDTVEGRWINQFVTYLEQQGISWTYWAWNPNSGDTGGVLQDDWSTVHPNKMALLTRLMRRPPVGSGSGFTTPVPEIGTPIVKVTPRTVIITTPITTVVAGIVTQSITQAGKQRCSSKRTTLKAGTYRIRCVLKRPFRASLRVKPATLQLRMTITPSTGAVTSAQRSVRLARHR